jgi:hypothetical protein
MQPRIRWLKSATIGPMADPLHFDGHAPAAMRLEALMGIPGGSA